MFCDGKNCMCRLRGSVSSTKPPKKAASNVGHRHRTGKDVFASIYKKVQRLSDGSNLEPTSSHLRRVGTNETNPTTTVAPPATTVRVNEIVSLPVEVGKRRKLSARQLNRLLKSGASRDEIYRLLEQYMVPRVRKNPNGASKRDLTHRKSEYREERAIMILLIMELPTLPLRGNVQLYCGRSVWLIEL
uniref:Uncharacterized protein n=1 Tax=Anopheles coluzzii TaxID=1518534 RepID=A0A8W7PWW2_ANOCL